MLSTPDTRLSQNWSASAASGKRQASPMTAMSVSRTVSRKPAPEPAVADVATAARADSPGIDPPAAEPPLAEPPFADPSRKAAHDRIVEWMNSSGKVGRTPVRSAICARTSCMSIEYPPTSKKLSSTPTSSSSSTSHQISASIRSVGVTGGWRVLIASHPDRAHFHDQ